jgi:SAM-dependent methyltransferase
MLAEAPENLQHPANFMDEPAINPPPAPARPTRNEFDEEGYLDLHPDIASGVRAGKIESGWRHFADHGFAEGRQWISRPDPYLGVGREISPRDEMFFGNETHYFAVGESALHCIEAALLAARRKNISIRKILDLPCGHGRVMRFLKKAFPAAALTACDLNRDGVDYCARVFGAVPVLSQEEIEKLSLPEDFDLIWCGSLLTHFPEKDCARFIRGFRRLLRPGGILVFTTHGRQCESGFVTGENKHGLNDQQIAELLVDYRRNGFGYVDYAGQPGYGFSLAHPSFVTANLIQHPAWHLIGYHENGWDKRQDVICLQKGFPPPRAG